MFLPGSFFCFSCKVYTKKKGKRTAKKGQKRPKKAIDFCSFAAAATAKACRTIKLDIENKSQNGEEQNRPSAISVPSIILYALVSAKIVLCGWTVWKDFSQMSQSRPLCISLILPSDPFNLMFAFDSAKKTLSDYNVFEKCEKIFTPSDQFSHLNYCLCL